jgi:hypothetical protein
MKKVTVDIAAPGWRPMQLVIPVADEAETADLIGTLSEIIPVAIEADVSYRGLPWEPLSEDAVPV